MPPRLCRSSQGKLGSASCAGSQIMPNPNVLWRHFRHTSSQRWLFPPCHQQASVSPGQRPWNASAPPGTRAGVPSPAPVGSATSVPRAAARVIGPRTVRTLQPTPPTRWCRVGQPPMTPRRKGVRLQGTADSRVYIHCIAVILISV